MTSLARMGEPLVSKRSGEVSSENRNESVAVEFNPTEETTLCRTGGVLPDRASTEPASPSQPRDTTIGGASSGKNELRWVSPIPVRRNPVLLLIAGIMLVFVAFQWKPVGAAQAPPADVGLAPHNLFVWKVNSGRGDVYLLGSVHVGRADIYPLPREIEQSFNSADYLVEETDPSKQDPAAARQFWVTHGRYTGGDRLENHLSDQTKMALSIYLQVTGRPPTALSLAKPWMVSLLIHREELQVYGFSGRGGFDKHFIDEAVASRKPVIGLETPDYQMNLVYWLYSSLSDEMQDKMLLSSILQARNSAQHLGAIFQAWQTGDVRAMEALAGEHGRDLQSRLFIDELVNKRNLRMAQQIEIYLNTPYTYFVVVGAAHLVGDRGIVKLLQTKGYKVDQLIGR
jgi:uncharacterized protein YbaP (TraB family)